MLYVNATSYPVGAGPLEGGFQNTLLTGNPNAFKVVVTLTLVGALGVLAPAGAGGGSGAGPVNVTLAVLLTGLIVPSLLTTWH